MFVGLMGNNTRKILDSSVCFDFDFVLENFNIGIAAALILLYWYALFSKKVLYVLLPPSTWGPPAPWGRSQGHHYATASDPMDQ